MPATENKKSRNCILVLGMHRSGTSATSGCLSLLGYQLGKQLVPAGEPNAKGYFENDSINRFNEGLLKLLNARWHDTLYMPDGWWKDERVKTKQPELSKILLEEFDPDVDFVIKDPRISVLLPFYLDVFQEMKILPRLIINFRNPFEVAASLKNRDNLSLSKSLLLWMDANLKAEKYSRTLPRLYTYYNSLLDDPLTSMQQIIDGLQLKIEITEKTETELNSFIGKELKHHTNKIVPDQPEIPEAVYQLFDLLKKLNFRDTELREQKRFDGISQRFYSGFRFFNGIDKAFQVVLKTVDQHSNRKFYAVPALPGFNQIRFLPEQSNAVSEFWIYPVNRRAALQFLNLKVRTADGEYLPVEIRETNAEMTLDDGTMIFEAEFPWLRITLDQALVLSEICCEIQFLAFSANTYRFSVRERDLYASELLSKIVQLQTENDNLVVTHETTVTNLENKITALLKENTDLIAAHGVVVEKLKSEIDHLKTENGKLIAVHEMIVTNLETKITHLQNENDNLIAAHGEIVTKLETEIVHLQKENKKLIVDHGATLTKLNTEITHYQTEIDKLVAGHKSEVNKLENENSRLKSEHLTSLNKFELENAKLSEELKFNREQLQLLMGSRSWKIGRSFTWPYRKLKEKYKNR